MVRGLILKRQLTCRGHLLLISPRQNQFYSVLASLSRSYPEFEGRLPTRYSPVRHFTLPTNRNFSFDLHVLGTPPAFVLSQDQTLQLNWTPQIGSFRIQFSKSDINALLIISIISPLSREIFPSFPWGFYTFYKLSSGSCQYSFFFPIVLPSPISILNEPSPDGISSFQLLGLSLPFQNTPFSTVRRNILRPFRLYTLPLVELAFSLRRQIGRAPSP